MSCSESCRQLWSKLISFIFLVFFFGPLSTIFHFNGKYLKHIAISYQILYLNTVFSYAINHWKKIYCVSNFFFYVIIERVGLCVVSLFFQKLHVAVSALCLHVPYMSPHFLDDQPISNEKITRKASKEVHAPIMHHLITQQEMGRGRSQWEGNWRPKHITNPSRNSRRQLTHWTLWWRPKGKEEPIGMPFFVFFVPSRIIEIY